LDLRRAKEMYKSDFPIVNIAVDWWCDKIQDSEKYVYRSCFGTDPYELTPEKMDKFRTALSVLLERLIIHHVDASPIGCIQLITTDNYMYDLLTAVKIAKLDELTNPHNIRMRIYGDNGITIEYTDTGDIEYLFVTEKLFDNFIKYYKDEYEQHSLNTNSNSLEMSHAFMDDCIGYMQYYAKLKDVLLEKQKAEAPENIKNKKQLKGDK
jgi:hypothetical protein